MGLDVGMVVPAGFWSTSIDARRRTLADISAAGIDLVYMADHVSFHDGAGTDGFVEVAALSQLNPDLRVMISIYLLPLRHPLPVARQLATMSVVAPGRMLFGVGIGGEDRHEMEVCGVDPSSRGRRTNESLAILRPLMAGETVDFDGEFFQLSQARIRPTVAPKIPIIVGGRSNAALTRAGRFGDGWVGVWCSPRRYTEALQLISEAADAAGRTDVSWLHGYQPWIGVGDSKTEARAYVASQMQAFYKLPFENFERYVPYGTPADCAAALKPYVEAGCSLMNLKICAADDVTTVTAAGEIARLLRA